MGLSVVECRYVMRIPATEGAGLTGPTSAANLPADVVQTITSNISVRALLERAALDARSRRLAIERESPRLAGQVRIIELTRTKPAESPADPLLARIEKRAERLLREQGLFRDSTEMIRELRDAGR